MVAYQHRIPQLSPGRLLPARLLFGRSSLRVVSIGIGTGAVKMESIKETLCKEASIGESSRTSQSSSLLEGNYKLPCSKHEQKVIQPFVGVKKRPCNMCFQKLALGRFGHTTDQAWRELSVSLYFPLNQGAKGTLTKEQIQ